MCLYLAALNIYLICFLKFKYYGTFTNITQIVHSKAHLNPLKGVVSDKPLISHEIFNFQFVEILNSQEVRPRNVLSFSHVCGGGEVFLFFYRLYNKLGLD